MDLLDSTEDRLAAALGRRRGHQQGDAEHELACAERGRRDEHRKRNIMRVLTAMPGSGTTGMNLPALAGRCEGPAAGISAALDDLVRRGLVSGVGGYTTFAPLRSR